MAAADARGTPVFTLPLAPIPLFFGGAGVVSAQRLRPPRALGLHAGITIAIACFPLTVTPKHCAGDHIFTATRHR